MKTATEPDVVTGRQLVRSVTALAGNVLLLPTLVFIIVALQKGMGFSEGGSALLEQYYAERSNLVIVSVLGLVPILLLCALLGVRRLVCKSWDGSKAYVRAAAVPILLVTIFVQISYWPSYLPTRQFMGFPHGLEFVIGPLIFAPIGVAFAWVVVWVMQRSRA